MNDVFIVYAHEDEAYCNALCQELERHGVKAQRDRDVCELGTRWHTDIQRALRSAQIGIYLASRHSNESLYVQSEEVGELGRKALLIPILVDADGRRSPSGRPLAWLHSRQLPNPDKPLREMTSDEQVACYRAVAARVADFRPGREVAVGSLATESDRASWIDEVLKGANGAHYPEAGAWHWLVEELLYRDKTQQWGTIRKLLRGFRQKCRQNGIALDPHHEAILQLFETDSDSVSPIPDKAWHLIIQKPNATDLLDSEGYAVLLQAIATVQRGSLKEGLEALENAPTNFERCPLRWYAVGQAQRQRNDQDSLGQAVGSLRRAMQAVDRAPTCQRCGGTMACQSSTMLVQIHRGSGAVARKQRRWSDAQSQFDKGLVVALPRAAAELKQLTELNGSESTKEFGRILKTACEALPSNEQKVVSDLLYSYGYFMYERAVLDEDVVDKCALLELAEVLLKRSVKLGGKPCAGNLRLGLVRQMLKRPAESIVGAYYDAWTHRVRDLRDLSSALTALAVLGNGSPLAEATPMSLFKDLSRFLLEVDIGSGPRECHAFDAVQLEKTLPQPPSGLLKLSLDLMKIAGQWKAEYEKQSDCVRQFLDEHEEELNDACREFEALEETKRMLEEKSGTFHAVPKVDG